MADPREVFPVVADAVTGEGENLIAIVEGDSTAAKNGILAFGAKNQAGNATLIELTADGSVPVDFSNNGIDHHARGTLVSGSQVLLTPGDVVVVMVPVSKTFEDFQFIVSCRRDALFQLVHVDDVTETVMADVIVGPGQFTFTGSFPHMFASSGATGDQEFKIVGTALDKVSDMRASLSFLEKA